MFDKNRHIQSGAQAVTQYNQAYLIQLDNCTAPRQHSLDYFINLVMEKIKLKVTFLSSFPQFVHILEEIFFFQNLLPFLSYHLDTLFKMCYIIAIFDCFYCFFFLFQKEDLVD